MKCETLKSVHVVSFLFTIKQRVIGISIKPSQEITAINSERRSRKYFSQEMFIIVLVTGNVKQFFKIIQ